MASISGFAARLAYLRWLRSAGRQKPETDRELAQAWEVGEKWLAKWKTSERAPEGRSEAAAIERALKPTGVSIAWLYDDEGPPPRPELWAVWNTPATGAGALQAAMSTGAKSGRGAQLEPKDVPAADPRKKSAGADKGKKRAG